MMINDKLQYLSAELSLHTLLVATRAHELCTSVIETESLSDIMIFDVEDHLDKVKKINEELVATVKQATDAAAKYSAIMCIDASAQSIQMVLNFMTILYQGIEQGQAN